MLSIPAIILAFAYGAVYLGQYQADWASVVIAAVVAAVTGVLALKWLFKQVQRYRLRWFAAYCWIVGTGALLLVAIYG
jgi:undecaprenyl pyrophosphate phosphatase UppP